MKKILVCLAVVGLAVFTSCKKDYVCTYPADNSTAEYVGLNKPASKTTQKTCEVAGGVWSVK